MEWWIIPAHCSVRERNCAESAVMAEIPSKLALAYAAIDSKKETSSK